MAMTIERARKIMGKASDSYRDEEIQEILNVLKMIANLAIDSYLVKRSKNG